MPAKRLQLDPDLEISSHFRVFGLETQLPDYKLTLRLNQKLRWRMRRVNSFRVFGKRPGAFEDFALYHYEWNDYAGLFLVIPISQINSLVPLSYFLIRGSLLPQQEKVMLSLIEAVEGIINIYPIDWTSGQWPKTYRDWLRNLLIDLEYHINDNIVTSATPFDVELI
ncbi:MAG: hypothetical protein ACP5O2_08540 [Bacteroidales bacterium]